MSDMSASIIWGLDMDRMSLGTPAINCFVHKLTGKLCRVNGLNLNEVFLWSYPHPEAWLNPGIHAHAAFLSLTRYASVMGVVPVLCGEILIAYNVMSWKYGCVSPFYDFQCASFWGFELYVSWYLSVCCRKIVQRPGKSLLLGCSFLAFLCTVLNIIIQWVYK